VAVYAGVAVIHPPEDAGRAGDEGSAGAPRFGTARRARRRARTLVDLAREFSPRIEVHDEWFVVLDASGLGRVLGDARAIGLELGRAALDCGWVPRVAVAATRTAVHLLVRAQSGLTVVPPGEEARVLAPLPVELLEGLPEAALRGDARATRAVDVVATLHRWGVRTLGELAALPAADLAARLGSVGPRLQRLARGEDVRPFVPAAEPARFEAACDLEWPLEDLAPLVFVVARLLDPLCAELERAGCGAVGVTLRLTLVTKDVYARRLELAAPTRDPHLLRTLVQLDLEAHRPPAGVDRVALALEPARRRVAQVSFLEAPHPPPDRVSALVARLTALMGAGRVGAPAVVDTHRPGAFAVEAFEPEAASRLEPPAEAAGGAAAARGILRRFRVPWPARVVVDAGRPVHLATGHRALAGGRVVQWAGPWRTSGWGLEPGAPWDRDEWDVLAADGVVYRLGHDRLAGRWVVDGLVD
jgi:protein ImuB